jgi:hypothetical protein
MKPIPYVGIGIGDFLQFFIGKGKLYLQFDDDSGMVIIIPFSRGLITKGRINSIIDCLNRLKTHAMD